MRFVLALLLVSAAVLAGCSQPRQPVTPSDPPVAPTTSSGPSGTPVAPMKWDGVYAGRLYGYGFIGPDQDGYGPLTSGIAVDVGGQVLAFHVAYKISGDTSGANLDLLKADEPWRAALLDVLKPGTVYPEGASQQLRVRDIAAGRLSDDDWQHVHAVFEDGLDHAREPHANEGGFVADGGVTYVGAHGQRVMLDDNHDRGDGWGTIEDQLARLQSWLDGSTTP